MSMLTKNRFKNILNIIKLVSVYALVLALALCIYPNNTAIAQQDNSNSTQEIIHQSSNSYTLTSGAVYENIRRFTTEGWLNINVIRVDTTNPNVKLDALTNGESMQKLMSVPSLTKSRNAAGAINGSFFNWSKTPGLNSPIGPIVESGKIITASSDFNRYGNSMATFAIGEMNRVFCDYWKTDIRLISENGASIPVARYNVQLNSNGDITVVNRQWSQISIGKPADPQQTVSSGSAEDSAGNTAGLAAGSASNTYSEIVEMVVKDNTVVEIRKNLPPVEIPENGYIVIAANNNTKVIVDNFKEGDIVNLEIATTPDWNNISMAVTGGAVILKDGAIPAKFSHDSPGRNPRTAIGSSKDGKQVIIVTVDGRQEKSLGMTLTELAKLMAELGAYNAINLDGGGSTTMTARKPGTNIINVVNSPSDGMPRSIANAIGVISTAPASPLAGLVIDTEDRNVFVNTSRSYTIRGYDNYYNPVEVNLEQVKWSVSGIDGVFQDNTFYPKSVGSGKIKATIGNISAEHEINSLSSPVELILSEKQIFLQTTGTKRFTVKGKNKNGYYAKINPEDITWSVSGDIGSFKGDTFTAAKEGKGYIEASSGDTKAYCAVSVAADVVVVADNFEKINGTYLSYPENIPGKYELSSEQKRSGNYSGKLTYDFNDSTGSRASYLLFSNGGYKLGNNVQKIGIWVYNSNPNPNWLRALIYDSKGGRHYIDITQNMDWTGWKYVETSVAGISEKPLTLARIYLVQTRDVPDAGHIYLDDLTFISIPDQKSGDISIPQDTIPADEANKAVSFQEGNNSFKFIAFGQSSKAPVNMLQNLLLRRLATKINENAETAAFIGSSSYNFPKAISKSVICVDSALKAYDIKNSRLIQLDTRKKGLRVSHPAQWKWFLTQLDSFTGDNVFIFMTDHPQNFSDKLETELFQDILTEYRQKTGRNIWVFYKSTINGSFMERGIKYISTAGYEIEDLNPSNANQVKYVHVTVQGKEVTFQFKPVVP